MRRGASSSAWLQPRAVLTSPGGRDTRPRPSVFQFGRRAAANFELLATISLPAGLTSDSFNRKRAVRVVRSVPRKTDPVSELPRLPPGVSPCCSRCCWTARSQRNSRHQNLPSHRARHGDIEPSPERPHRIRWEVTAPPPGKMSKQDARTARRVGRCWEDKRLGNDNTRLWPITSANLRSRSIPCFLSDRRKSTWHGREPVPD